VFVTAIHFDTSLIFAGKDRAPYRTPLLWRLLALPANIRLGWN